MKHNYNIKGTLSEWQENIGRYAVGNNRMVFAISTAFAAPLIKVTDSEGGGFHFRGMSSIGKSTLLHVAGSVWGGNDTSPLGYLQQWRTTDNALEGIAAMHNDTLLCLDELSQVEPKAAGNSAYMLAIGQGKSRASRSGSWRKPKNWMILFLSNGEISLSDKLAEDRSGRKILAGQEMRVIDLQADAGKGFGLYENIYDFKNGSAFSDYLKTAAKQYHGVPAVEFLDLLIKDLPDRKHVFKDQIAEFVKRNTPLGATGQIKRCAARFGLVAIAGELAITYGIAPWPEGEATKAAEICFQAWLADRNNSEPTEITQGILQVKQFLEEYGDSRFATLDENLKSADPSKDNRRAGFKRKTHCGYEYFILPTIYKNEVCRGFDATLLTKAMVERGYIRPRNGGKMQYSMRFPGFSNAKSCYYVLPTIFFEDDQEAANNEVKGSVAYEEKSTIDYYMSVGTYDEPPPRETEYKEMLREEESKSWP